MRRYGLTWAAVMAATINHFYRFLESPRMRSACAGLTGDREHAISGDLAAALAPPDATLFAAK